MCESKDNKPNAIQLKKALKSGQTAFESLDVASLEALLAHESELLLIGDADIDFINACSNRLSELLGDKLKTKCTTEEIISAKKSRITIVDGSTSLRKIPKKLFLIAAIMSSLLWGFSIAGAYYVDSGIFREYRPYTGDELLSEMESIALLPEGTILDKGNVTFIRPFESAVYDSYNEYLAGGFEPLAFPTPYIDGSVSAKIICTNNEAVEGLPDGFPKYVISVETGDPFLGIYVYFDYNMRDTYQARIDNGDSAYKLEQHNGIDFYICTAYDNMYGVYEYMAMYQIGNDFYSINTRDIDVLTKLISETKLP